MNENEISYRGSKSTINGIPSQKFIAVKEQRLDGN